jgi:hypothetical protein
LRRPPSSRPDLSNFPG